jgi:hypothetical protein
MLLHPDRVGRGSKRGRLAAPVGLYWPPAEFERRANARLSTP